MLSRVSPFRYLRINGYLLLPEAFRSLSRLSSALSAKASTLRSSSLNQLSLPCSVTAVGLGFYQVHNLQKQAFKDHYVLRLPLGNLLGCLSLKYLRKNFLFCMRFSRYMFIWLFYQPSKTKRLFNLRSLVKPVIYNSASPLKQVNTFIPVRRVFILLRARTCLFYIKSKMLSFVIPAATCSPVPSPAKYHRPLRS